MLKHLKELLKAKIKEQQGVVSKVNEEKRGLTEEELKSFDDIQAEIDGLKKSIEAAEKAAENDAFMNEPGNEKFVPAPASMDTQKEAREDYGFKNLGEFVFAVSTGRDEKGRIDSIVKDMRMDVGEAGGIMVPPAFKDSIMQFSAENAIVRPRATVIGADSATPDQQMKIPVLKQGANGANAGVTVVWTGEGQTMSETEGKIDFINLNPQEMTAYTEVSNKLLRNWAGTNAFIENLLRSAVISAEDLAFLVGDGNGKPLGIQESGCAIKIDRDTTAKVLTADIVGMEAKIMADESGAAYVYVISQSAKPQIMTLKDDAGNNIFLQGNIAKKEPDMLIGRPIIWTGKVPTVGNEGDVSLVDISKYLVKDGYGPLVAVSPHVKFTSNMSVVKIVYSVDGQAWAKDPLTLEDGSTQVSPFVILK